LTPPGPAPYRRLLNAGLSENSSARRWAITAGSRRAPGGPAVRFSSRSLSRFFRRMTGMSP